MARFLALTLFLVMAMGLCIHQEVDLGGYGDWMGHLPGDLMIRKNGIEFYLPFTSAVLISGAVSLFFSLLTRK